LTGGRIARARFIGYEQGGHLLVGRDEAIQQEILHWVVPRAYLNSDRRNASDAAKTSRP